MLALGIQSHTGDHQIHDTAQCSHQIDDGVGSASQWLWCDVRHQSNRRAAVGSHGNQKCSQYPDKECQFGCRRVLIVRIIDEWDQKHQDDCCDRSKQDKWLTLAPFALAPVGNTTKERQ